ncbi:MAG: DNA recombination protein RmuC [Dehalococcoidia bacterium]|jgi:DNA recombination protein RmuC
MEALVVVLLVILIGAVGLLAWERLRAPRVDTRADVSQMLNMTQQNLERRIEGLDQRLTAGLNTVQQTMSQSLTATAETIRSVGQQLGRLESSSQQMLEVGKNIGQLQDVLKPPKMRGGFGELLLENLLTQILPPENYRFQYHFRNGEAVDAVICLGSGLVPIDSKFPMESFNRMVAAESDEERATLRRGFLRDVRSHVDGVAKYIMPDEGTFEFALMYIPAEGVYYETFSREDMVGEGEGPCAYALSRRVIPVSPNSFYGYLQAIVLGLKGLRVEERAREIIDHLGQLGKEFDGFREEFGVLGGHIGRAKGKYDELDKRVGRLGDRLLAPLRDEWEQLPPGESVEGEAG